MCRFKAGPAICRPRGIKTASAFLTVLARTTYLHDPSLALASHRRVKVCIETTRSRLQFDHRDMSQQQTGCDATGRHWLPLLSVRFQPIGPQLHDSVSK